ncbi:MAG: UDP-N-acetylglucosamine 2-epimerase (hydrolyzing) [Paludibacteraceae bacterium]|nr:UDP-N-acetylglucosamine 2-epimerase (hydrolyzing) [Paludibacteraceae bacterium]
MKRKICFFTGTRAEYGIMSRLMRMVKESENCDIQIIATNMHLSPEFGLTYKEIEADGFIINKKVEMLLSSDTANGTVKSMGLATIGFADALEDLKPDLAVILGDRYEMLAAAQACLIYKVPIAHLYGGEITEGAYDNSIRHAITKLSSLHFTSTEEYRKRVIQMGEEPDRVFYVGSLGVDNIKHESTMSRDELERSLNFHLGDKFLLITFHPVTMENATAASQCDDLLKVLSTVNDEYQLLFTLPNSDTDGRIIASKVKEYASAHVNKSLVVDSLGKKRYYSALKYATAVVGNSSSGLVEAPSFGIPTLNIGNRQKGRTRGESVIDVEASYQEMYLGLQKALSENFRAIASAGKNPYEKENTLQAIFNVIENHPLHNIGEKHFYDL